MKYYKSLQDPETPAGEEVQFSDGAYLFRPNGTHSFDYSQIDPDVQYEQGRNLEQWTIKFTDEPRQQHAIVKVRFSPLFDELIEFDVELGPVPVNDNQGKDVMVNWRMYDNFNGNQTFYTDSNGLEMQERRINYRPTFSIKDTNQNVSSNFYPVTSAIALRDT